MKKVRFGIVGMGSMGNGHAKNFVKETRRDFALTAVCDIEADRSEKAGNQYDVPHFTDAEEMYDSGLIDAALIATPHYAHGPLTIMAARRGLHVLCEKPLSSSVSHARAMIDECERCKVVLGVVLQHRTFAPIVKARQIVESGVLGEIFRTQMIMSAAFRTQAYYDSGAWRGTWDGEGGGVLINQTPHHLDSFQYVGMGLPKRLTALVATREHKVEIEDTAGFLCDYGDGKTGYFFATTAEEPGFYEFTIVGEKGTLVVEADRIRHGKLKIPVRDHIYGGGQGNVVERDRGPSQKVTWKDVKIPSREGRLGHGEIVRGFVREVLGKGGQYAPGAEAINELELSNAAYLSGYSGKAVDLPVDGGAMDRLLAKLERERSTGRGGGMRAKYYAQFKKLMSAGRGRRAKR